MSNSRKYKNLFDKINITEDKIEHIYNIQNENKRTRRSFKTGYAMAVMTIVVAFAVGNGITYAATGSSLVKTVYDGVKNEEETIKNEKLKPLDDYKKLEEKLDENRNKNTIYEIEKGVTVGETVPVDSEYKIESYYDEELDGVVTYIGEKEESEEEVTTHKK